MSNSFHTHKQSFNNPLKYVFNLLLACCYWPIRKKGRNNGVAGHLQYDKIQDKYFRFDVRMLTIDHEMEHYQSENQYMLNNQDISLLAIGGKNDCLVATVSVSSDIRCYDPYAFQPLTYIKRSIKLSLPLPLLSSSLSSSSSSSTSLSASFEVNSLPSNIHPINSHLSLRNRFPTNCCNKSSKDYDINTSSTLIARTSGNVLKTIVDGISVEDKDNEDDFLTEDHLSTLVENTHATTDACSLTFQPIWCLDIFDYYVLAGCGDGRLEVWDSKTGELAYIHYPMDNIGRHEISARAALGITVLKTAYWGAVVARLSGTLDLLEMLEDCGDHTNNSEQKKRTKSIKYRIRHTIQAHQQPVTRLEIIDSLKDEDFIHTFGSRGCLISGSLDNTLKVFSLDQAKYIYTLNGHCGGISITAIDQVRRIL